MRLCFLLFLSHYFLSIFSLFSFLFSLFLFLSLSRSHSLSRSFSLSSSLFLSLSFSFSLSLFLSTSLSISLFGFCVALSIVRFLLGLDDPALDAYPEYYFAANDDAEALVQVDVVKGLLYLVACPHHWGARAAADDLSASSGVSFGAGGELLQVRPEAPELRAWRDGRRGDEAPVPREADPAKSWRGADQGFDDFKCGAVVSPHSLLCVSDDAAIFSPLMTTNLCSFSSWFFLVLSLFISTPSISFSLSLPPIRFFLSLCSRAVP